MGSKSSKRPKTLEPYNSFEALPTSNEFFNRQLQQQQQQTQQQLLSQHSTASMGQFQQPFFGHSTLSNQYPSSILPQQLAPPPQGMFFGFQQPARLALPPYGQTPQMSPYGPRLQVGYMGQSHGSLSLGRHTDTLSRRHFSMYPSSGSPQIVQSVPKFNQHSPIVKF